MGATENVQQGDDLVVSPDTTSHCFPKENMLPSLEVTGPESDSEPETEAVDQEPQTLQLKAKLDCDGGLGFGPLWKLERRESGSLYWRRDSIANTNSKVKFRYDVDVLEFLPHPNEHDRLAHERSDGSDVEDDLYDDDWCLDDDAGWLRRRRAQIFGANSSSRTLGNKDSSVLVSLVCVAAILVTAYVQLVVV